MNNIKAKYKKYYRVIGFIILALIFTKIDFSKITVIFSQVNIFKFIYISLLIIPCLFLKAYRWRYLLRLAGIDYSLKEAFFSYLGGAFVGLITPVKLGEAIKVVYLKEEKNIPFSRSLPSVFIDRFLDLYSVIILGIISLWLFMPASLRFSFLSVVSAVFIIISPFIIFNRKVFSKAINILYKIPLLKKYAFALKDKIDLFIKSLEVLLGGQIFVALAMTFISYVPFYIQGFLLSSLLGLKISFLKIVFFISVVKLASTLPITLLGIGTREASLVYLFSLEGLSAESAIAYSLLIFMSFQIFCGILCFLGWLIKGGKRSRVEVLSQPDYGP